MERHPRVRGHQVQRPRNGRAWTLTMGLELRPAAEGPSAWQEGRSPPTPGAKAWTRTKQVGC